MKLAIFDFDGTIYKYETFTILMRHLRKSDSKRYYRFYTKILPVYLAYKAKLLSEKKMKAILMQQYTRSLRHLSTTEQAAFFTVLAEKMATDVNMDVIHRIKQHKENGFSTLIVSGAFTPLLEAFLTVAPVDQVIGTNIPAPTEKIDHIHAERKTEVIQDAFSNTEINWAESYAYGDSAADLAVLELVGHPVAVQPDEPLAYAAKERGWEIMY